MKQNTGSLRRRLLIRLVAPLILLLLLSAISTYALALRIANRIFDVWLYDSVNSLALLVQSDNGHAQLNFPGAAKLLFEWDATDSVYYAVVGERSGLIAGRGDISELSGQSRNFQHAQIFEAPFLGKTTSFAVLPLPEKVYGETVRVIVGETARKRDQQARELFLSSLLPQAVVILLALGIIWFGVRGALKPLLQLAERLRQQNLYRVAPIADTSAPEEVLPLTHAFNDLLTRLEVAMSGQRKFIADAAHQLRTPLTALKLNITEARQAANPLQAETALGHLQESTDRAIRLSNQLLALARAEHGMAALNALQVIDLQQLAREVGAEWVPRAYAKNIDLSFEASALPVLIKADAVLLREALNNLLDNAIKYHPGQGNIVVQVSTQPVPNVSVVDDGPGIADEHRHHIFQRFFRGDHSSSDGSGLGLAIVQEIAHAHGGSVRVGKGLNGKGLSITIDLPGRNA